MKVIAFTDSVTTCECCGRTELKGTYLVFNESNEYYYGSTCVKRNLNISTSELTKQINQSLKERKQNAYNEFTYSDLNKQYDEARKVNYEYGDDYYYNVIKPISASVSKLRNEILNKYNLQCF